MDAFLFILDISSEESLNDRLFFVESIILIRARFLGKLVRELVEN